MEVVGKVRWLCSEPTHSKKNSRETTSSQNSPSRGSARDQRYPRLFASFLLLFPNTFPFLPSEPLNSRSLQNILVNLPQNSIFQHRDALDTTDTGSPSNGYPVAKMSLVDLHTLAAARAENHDAVHKILLLLLGLNEFSILTPEEVYSQIQSFVLSTSTNKNSVLSQKLWKRLLSNTSQLRNY